jgi:hypothetical protein
MCVAKTLKEVLNLTIPWVPRNARWPQFRSVTTRGTDSGSRRMARKTSGRVAILFEALALFEDPRFAHVRASYSSRGRDANRRSKEGVVNVALEGSTNWP